MAKVQNFSEHLERSLQHIGCKVGEQMERPESAARSEREIVKESIRSIAKEIVPAAPLPAPVSSKSSGQDDHGEEVHLPSYVAKANIDPAAKRMIERLVHMAFSIPGGLEKAIREAKKQPFFIEDAFHDALVDKALPELKKRGVLKES